MLVFDSVVFQIVLSSGSLVLSSVSISFVKLEKESLALSIHTYFYLVPIYY